MEETRLFQVLHTLDPVYDARSRVLLLGSMPSPKSRETGFYYGNPQNRFWRVLAAVLSADVPLSVAEKRALCLSRGVALWDVLAACRIRGAADASIREAKANDIGWLLKKALYGEKDQSYVLYVLTQDELAHTRFPLGGMDKPSIRVLAEKAGFCNAHKHDSQDICFVPDGDYVGFMERYTGKFYPDGDFIDTTGKVVGRHHGAVRYTNGQRKGLGLALGAPVYVCDKDMEKNTVTVGPESELFTTTLVAGDFNWISIPELTAPMRVKAKARYRQPEQPATVRPLPDGKVEVEFDEPERAITRGQAVVLYDGDVVVGGGTIL